MQLSSTRDPEELPPPAGSPGQVSQGHLASVCPPVEWALTETTPAVSGGPGQGCYLGRYSDPCHHSLPPVRPEPSETRDHSPRIGDPEGRRAPLGREGCRGRSRLRALPPTSHVTMLLPPGLVQLPPHLKLGSRLRAPPGSAAFQAGPGRPPRPPAVTRCPTNGRH